MEIRIRKSLLIVFLAGAFLLGVCLTGAVLLIQGYQPGQSSGGGSGGDTITDSSGGSITGEDKFKVLDMYVDQYYLDDYNETEMMENAYRGYIEGLNDPYSAYMDPKEYDSFLATATGEYSGIGVTFSQDDNGNYVVLEVSPNSPADKAGFKPGDYLLTVDGKTYTNIDTLATDIRGTKGTKVTIEYSRDGEMKEATMIRDDIVQESVEYKMLDGDIGYIKISSFIDNTAADFDRALKAVQKDGAKKLVLDLRDNGGGLVDQCVDVADQFLDEGVVCYTEDKNGETDSYNAKDGKTDLETVVLINENSASASEILAGALKDNGFKTVGVKTFGKGVIQSTIELKDGSALKLTIMQYLSPDKHVINKKGIKPEYKVKDKEKTDTDEQLDKAIELLK